MVKFVQCVTRKPGLEAIEFRTRWNEYGRRLQQVVEHRPNVVRFRLSTTLLVRATATFMVEYGSAPPFDGMVELWLEDANFAATNMREDEPTRRLLRELHDMLAAFVDPEKTTAFYAAEEMDYDRAGKRAARSA